VSLEEAPDRRAGVALVGGLAEAGDVDRSRPRVAVAVDDGEDDRAATTANATTLELFVDTGLIAGPLGVGSCQRCSIR
jgi:hypothetical protein